MRRSARFNPQTEELAGSVFAQEEVLPRQPRKKKAAAAGLSSEPGKKKQSGVSGCPPRAQRGRNKENRSLRELPVDDIKTDDIEVKMQQLALDTIDLNCPELKSSAARKRPTRRKPPPKPLVKTSFVRDEHEADQFPVFSPPALPVELSESECAAQSLGEGESGAWGRTLVMEGPLELEDTGEQDSLHKQEAGRLSSSYPPNRLCLSQPSITYVSTSHRLVLLMEDI